VEYTRPSSPDVVKVQGFAVILRILLLLSFQLEEGTCILIQTQCAIKYLTGFEVLTQGNVMFKVWI
jgi:hypothetical protein